MKSTATTDPKVFISSVKKNLDELASPNFNINGFFPDIRSMHIYVPKILNNMEEEWTKVFKAQYPNINIVLKTIETSIGL